MILNLYLFLNITLATIYTSFKKNIEEEVKFLICLRRKKLENAFNLLKAHAKDYTQKYSINYETFKMLMKKIYPNKSENKTRIIFNLLDRDRGNHLCKCFLGCEAFKATLSTCTYRFNLFFKLTKSFCTLPIYSIMKLLKLMIKGF
jgi:hypothetical protein